MANGMIIIIDVLLQAVMVLNLAIEGDRAFARATGGVVESKFFLNRRVGGYRPVG